MFSVSLVLNNFLSCMGSDPFRRWVSSLVDVKKLFQLTPPLLDAPRVHL